MQQGLAVLVSASVPRQFGLVWCSSSNKFYKSRPSGSGRPRRVADRIQIQRRGRACALLAFH